MVDILVKNPQVFRICGFLVLFQYDYKSLSVCKGSGGYMWDSVLMALSRSKKRGAYSCA